MTRRAILQIGTEKTGTTTLQTFLAANRDRLAERGFLYPRFCGEINHTGLAAYALDDARPDELKDAFGGHGPADLPEMRARLERRAAAELTGEQTVIFCNEHCHSRLTSPGEVQRLRDFLARHFDEVRISVYLRRQDQIALSLYSTKLKSGGIPDEVLPPPVPESPYFNYDRFLSLWENAFGRDAVSVRIFDRTKLMGGSIVDDFLGTWSIGPAAAFRSVPNENGSLATAAQEFLRLANPALNAADPGVGSVCRGRIVTGLSALFPGKGARPSRQQAMQFYDTYRDSNREVARRHFPGCDNLFDETFDSYPDQPDARDVGLAEIAEVAIGLLVQHGRVIARLEGEIAIREAGLLWHRAKAEAALDKLRSAIARSPDHAGLHRTLAEYLYRLQHSDDCIPAAETACCLDPANWEYRHFLGIVLAASGNFEAAAEAQRETLALNPGYPGAERALQSALAETDPARRRTA